MRRIIGAAATVALAAAGSIGLATPAVAAGSDRAQAVSVRVDFSGSTTQGGAVPSP